MKNYLVLFILLFFLSCKDDISYKGKTLIKANINVKHELFTHIIEDEKNVYIFGEIENDYSDFRTKKISIDYSNKSNLRKWISFNDFISGFTQCVSDTKDFIFIVSKEYGDKFSSKGSVHKLYRIKKDTKNVELIHTFNNENMFFRFLSFTSKIDGYGIVRKSGKVRDYMFLETNDGGKNWDILNIKKPIVNHQLVDRKLYFTTGLNNNHWIYSIDIDSAKLDSLKFNMEIVDFKVDKNGYSILGKNNQGIIFNNYDKKGFEISKYMFSNRKNFFPSELYKYKNLLVAIIKKRDDDMLGGFGGTKHMLYISNNNGKNWEKSVFHSALYLNPLSLYQDESIIAYIGGGNFISQSPLPPE